MSGLFGGGGGDDTYHTDAARKQRAASALPPSGATKGAGDPKNVASKFMQTSGPPATAGFGGVGQEESSGEWYDQPSPFGGTMGQLWEAGYN